MEEPKTSFGWLRKNLKLKGIEGLLLFLAVILTIISTHGSPIAALKYIGFGAITLLLILGSRQMNRRYLTTASVLTLVVLFFASFSYAYFDDWWEDSQSSFGKHSSGEVNILIADFSVPDKTPESGGEFSDKLRDALVDSLGSETVFRVTRVREAWDSKEMLRRGARRRADIAITGQLDTPGDTARIRTLVLDSELLKVVESREHSLKLGGFVLGAERAASYDVARVLRPTQYIASISSNLLLLKTALSEESVERRRTLFHKLDTNFARLTELADGDSAMSSFHKAQLYIRAAEQPSRHGREDLIRRAEEALQESIAPPQSSRESVGIAFSIEQAYYSLASTYRSHFMLTTSEHWLDLAEQTYMQLSGTSKTPQTVIPLLNFLEERLEYDYELGYLTRSEFGQRVAAYSTWKREFTQRLTQTSSKEHMNLRSFEQTEMKWQARSQDYGTVQS